MPRVTDSDDTYDHFLDILDLPSYLWVPYDIRKVVDLRRQHILYLKNIRAWMEREDSLEAPYKACKQYKMICNRIKKLERKEELTKAILQRSRGLLRK